METYEILEALHDLMDAVIKKHRGGLMLAVGSLEVANLESPENFTEVHTMIENLAKVSYVTEQPGQPGTLDRTEKGL